MTAFIELDAATLDPDLCVCTHCANAAASTAASTSATATTAAPRRSLARAAATSALVAVGGTVAGTGLTLGTAAGAAALAAPSRPGWDGHRYWFRSHGEWRWTSHYDIYLRHAGGSATTTAPDPTPPYTGGVPLHQGWDGRRYWFQRNGEWRWTSHYDIYLRYTSGSAAPTPTPPGPPTTPNPGPPTGPPGVPTPGPPSTPLPVQPGPVPAPPVVSDADLETAIAFASAQLGKPYVWGGNGPYGYDCSGLVQQSFLQAGIELPRVAADQFWATLPITADDLRRGDLLFWSSSSRASGIHHVAIYLGGGRYIEAPRPGKTVRVSVLTTDYYPTHFGRVVE
jgi:cell wall-associated NlpC family hydrolase